jgi:hypothetical protein
LDFRQYFKSNPNPNPCIKNILKSKSKSGPDLDLIWIDLICGPKSNTLDNRTQIFLFLKNRICYENNKQKN